MHTHTHLYKKYQLNTQYLLDFGVQTHLHLSPVAHRMGFDAYVVYDVSMCNTHCCCSICIVLSIITIEVIAYGLDKKLARLNNNSLLSKQHERPRGAIKTGRQNKQSNSISIQ